MSEVSQIRSRDAHVTQMVRLGRSRARPDQDRRGHPWRQSSRGSRKASDGILGTVWDCNTRAHEPSPRTWDTCARSDTSARHASDPHIMRNVNRAPRREPGRSDLLRHAFPTAHQPHAKGMAPKHPGRRTPRRSPCPHSTCTLIDVRLCLSGFSSCPCAPPPTSSACVRTALKRTQSATDTRPGLTKCSG